MVCHEAIDQYIYCVAPELIRDLLRRHPKRRPKRPYRQTGECLTNRNGLERRPIAATARRVGGRWEAVTLLAGDCHHGLNVLGDRKSRLPPISFLAQKAAAETDKVIRRRLKNFHKALRQSITYDDGGRKFWP